MSAKRTIAILPCLLLLLIPGALRAAPAPDDHSYVIQMVATGDEEADEVYVAQVYDAFLKLMAGRTLKAGSLAFPATWPVKKDGFVVISRGYYISPNERRGFELSIPKDAFVEKDGILASKGELAVRRQGTRAGTVLMELKRKPIAARAAKR